MAPVKVTFKTVQGNKFELELDSSDKVRFAPALAAPQSWEGATAPVD
jgi:hypothetical protein